MIKFFLKLNFKCKTNQKDSIIKLCKEYITSDKTVEIAINIDNKMFMILSFISDKRIIFVNIIDRSDNSVDTDYIFSDTDFDETYSRLKDSMEAIYYKNKRNDTYYHDIVKNYFENYNGDTDYIDINIDIEKNKERYNE